MRIHCPHCQAPLNIVDFTTMQEASCPSCGSHFQLSEQTVTYGRTKLDHVGHFDLLEKVGVGQFGEVWKARDGKLNRIVAVKLPRREGLTDSQRKLFLREAQAAAALEHPNIVRVLEVGEEDDQVFIVSQFIKGVTLRDLIQANSLTLDESVRMMTLIADAVHHGHEAGVIHRDLKPSNILVDTDRQPFVSDFGLAKNNNAELTVTVSGAILGTPAYMSPEQARGESHTADRRSDVYSLGVVLYEMLTGKKPFEGSTTLLLHQIQSSDPRSLRAIKPFIPRDLETVCLKALEKKPERRYPTAAEFAAELRRVLAGESIVARPASRLEKSWRWVSRHRALSIVALVAIASTTLATSFALNPDGPVIPKGAELTIVKPLRVQLKTKPDGAKLVLHPIDPATGLPNPEKSVRPAERTPLALDLLPGDYLVVAVLDDNRFHEVYRHIPGSPTAMPSVYPHRNWKKLANDELSLATIPIPEDDITETMAPYEGANDFLVGLPQSPVVPQHPRRIAPFYLDVHEVTAQEYRKGNLGQLPFTRIGKEAEHPPDVPITALFFDEALMYAERVGKRLPTEFEYEFAATQRGTTLFPWGDTPPPADGWKLGPAAVTTFDRSPANGPVLGLFSNASEFVDSRNIPYPSSGIAGLSIPGADGAGYVVVRGGGLAQPAPSELSPRWRTPLATMATSRQVGFRCARSRNPRLAAGDF